MVQKTSRTIGQGDVLATWALWALLLVAMAVTYTRLGTADLYNVSRSGIDGALSRMLVQVNYPISLVAIAIVLISMDTLAGRWWWLGGAAIAACAVTAWPGVVDEGNLDARPINLVPALGVVAALVLSYVAGRQTSTRLAPTRPLDRVRVAIALVVVFLSLPWIAGNLGFYLPDFGFVTERPITGSDGVTNPAVHLGQHHGFDGSLLLLSALLLSRPAIRSRVLGRVTTAYVSLMAVYGAVNATQDFWHEQIQKREWVDWTFPKATEPALTLIWLIMLAGAVATYVLFKDEGASEPRAASDLSSDGG